MVCRENIDLLGRYDSTIELLGYEDRNLREQFTKNRCCKVILTSLA